MATWTAPAPGGSFGPPYSSFFDINSQVWGTETPIQSPSSANRPTWNRGYSQGFIASWTLPGPLEDVYANVSLSDVNWMNSSALVASGATGFPVVAGCGNQQTLLVSWNASNLLGGINVSNSTDGGNTWTTSTQIATGSPINGHGVNCITNNNGFLVVYADDSQNLWSIFSPDGINWGNSPVQIGTNLAAVSLLTPALSATNTGFIVAWCGQDSNVYASYSSNNGNSWTNPVQVINDSSAYQGNFMSVDLASSNDYCIVTWINANTREAMYSISRFSTEPDIAPSINSNNSGLYYRVTLNTPGLRIFR
ncbi:MAG: hypothetical protein ACOYK9_02390 [Chlamydiia bacterium]